MTPTTRRALSWGIPALVLLAIVAFVLQGADGPANPSFRDVAGGTPDTTVSERLGVSGFGEISYRIDGTGMPFGGGASVSAVRCALLAATAEQHSKGLMGRPDLAGFDGMLFRFDDDTQASFYMKDTLIPLSIAWFDAEGRLVSTADMAPCGDQPVCPTYGPDGPYRYALEVAEGDLPALGIGPGARLIVGENRC